MAKKKTKKTTSRKVVDTITYPVKLLTPVSKYLNSQLKKLEKHKKEIESEDPFKANERTSAHASPDTDAEEQFGHVRTSAIGAQIDKNIIQTRKALARIKIGEYGICENCSHMINTDRLMIKPEATYCIKCEEKLERESR